MKWRGTESNRRHKELQSFALPTELPSHLTVHVGFEPTISSVTGRRDKPLLQWTKLRELDLNQRPSGYEPDELPDCSIPRCIKIFQKWRRNWDSNPGASFPTYRFSRPDPSATWVFLQMFSTGGPCRTRTYDPPVMSRMLWPTELRVHFLSKWWLGWDSNPRPSGYEPDALAN